MVDLSVQRRGPSELEQPREVVRQVVSLGWLIALCVDRLSFPQFMETPAGVLSLALAVLALGRRRDWLIMGTIAADAVVLLSFMPDLGNHMVFRVLVDGLLLTWFATKRFSPLPSIRVLVISMYVLAVVHKLNSSFLDPGVSCAGFIVDTTLAEVGAGPAGVAVTWIGIGSTFLFEAGIPLLLVVPRTRTIGLLVGTGFHTALAIVPIGGVASFSAFMFAGYLAFVPPAILGRLDRWLTSAFVVPAARLGRLFLPAVLVGTALFAVAADVGPGVVLRLARFAGLVLGLVVLALYAAGDRKQASLPSSPSRPSSWVSLGLIPILLVAGLSPYAGARTQAALSMFSNLRTETEPNHLFLRLPTWFGYQEDLIDIDEAESTVLTSLGAGDLVTPGYEVRRQLADVDGDGFLVFDDQSGRHRLTLTEARIRFPPPNRLERFLFRMKQVRSTGPNVCSH